MTIGKLEIDNASAAIAIGRLDKGTSPQAIALTNGAMAFGRQVNVTSLQGIDLSGKETVVSQQPKPTSSEVVGLP